MFDSETTRLMPLQEVIKITGIQRATIYKKINEGSFPKAVKLSPTCVRWRSDEIQQWIEELPRH
ncbi:MULTISPECIES: helix-turn-helix transcriptional regulator [Brucella/Ochrobactrum group]|uniref:AlpA family phage regulatory protein n=2 Tax=Brucella TaxID=234 RepID=A0A6L3YEE6_9HYPH|nr:AlpA family phage regulatory protein [Brucella tritici]MPR62153.1 AlpA family phage regulatory protein [Brucella intermedia]